jgi:hypothetical protein
MPQQRGDDPIQRYGPGLSPMLSPFSREGALGRDIWTINSPSSRVAPQTQTAWYYPIQLPTLGTAYKFFWLNGATAATDHVQVGLYADNGSYKPGASILLGTSTLASGASVNQFDASIAATLIGPGLCWLAIWIGGTTTTLYGSSPSAMRMTRNYQQASLTSGLPSTATPAAASQSFGVPFFVFGIQTRPSP